MTSRHILPSLRFVPVLVLQATNTGVFEYKLHNSMVLLSQVLFLARSSTKVGGSISRRYQTWYGTCQATSRLPLSLVPRPSLQHVTPIEAHSPVKIIELY